MNKKRLVSMLLVSAMTAALFTGRHTIIGCAVINKDILHIIKCLFK